MIKIKKRLKKIGVLVPIICSFFILPKSLSAIELQPWFGNVLEFALYSKYSLAEYDKVESSNVPLAKKAHDHLFMLDVELPISPQFSYDLDLEFMGSEKNSFNFRSAALQLRYCFYDDIVGDPLALTLGFNFRGVAKNFTKDISTFYPGVTNFEALLAIGKEFCQEESWRFRLWGNGGFGIAERGSPWVRGKISFEGNHSDALRWAFFSEAYHGYGRLCTVDLNNFTGYGSIRTKAIDLGFKVGQKLGDLGVFSFEFRRRVFAKRAPEEVNNFAISYLLTFSF